MINLNIRLVLENRRIYPGAVDRRLPATASVCHVNRSQHRLCILRISWKGVKLKLQKCHQKNESLQ